MSDLDGGLGASNAAARVLRDFRRCGSGASNVGACATAQRFASRRSLDGRTEDDVEGQKQTATFQQALAELGWTSHKNIEFDYR